MVARRRRCIADGVCQRRRRRGWVIIRADALQRLREGPVDLILLDYRLEPAVVAAWLSRCRDFGPHG